MNADDSLDQIKEISVSEDLSTKEIIIKQHS